jgi:hypothetical protein
MSSPFLFNTNENFANDCLLEQQAAEAARVKPAEQVMVAAHQAATTVQPSQPPRLLSVAEARPQPVISTQYSNRRRG